LHDFSFYCRLFYCSSTGTPIGGPPIVVNFSQLFTAAPFAPHPLLCLAARAIRAKCSAQF
jgi:hypothetical protein